jgi:hypothetical protein
VKRLMQSAAIVPLLAAGVAAQDTQQLDIAKKRLAEIQSKLTMSPIGAIKGPTVKGLPYSAEEITETNQTLADGTRIHREIKATVYRDSEGRTRRETPDNVTINDPAAGMAYVINPKNNEVRTLKMAVANYVRREGTAGVAVGGGATGFATTAASGTFEMRVSGDGPPNIIVDGKPLDPKQVEEMINKAKAAGKVEGDNVFVMSGEPGAHTMMAAPVLRRMAAPNSEQLGKKNVEGVIAEGTRSVQTIPVGDIGNDRPIEVVNEHWYSEEIQMTVMTRRSDPRTGEETFRLTNIRRGDPPAYLFQAPADSHSNERKM